MEAVRSLREAAGLNQTMFSLRVGVSVSTIYRWESQNPPRGPVLARLAELAQTLKRPDLQGTFNFALGENLATTPNNEHAGAPESARWHALLDVILTSGSEKDRIGIQQNLEWGASAVRSREGPKSHHKAG